jgi:hypothetical protein
MVFADGHQKKMAAKWAAHPVLCDWEANLRHHMLLLLHMQLRYRP